MSLGRILISSLLVLCLPSIALAQATESSTKHSLQLSLGKHVNNLAVGKKEKQVVIKSGSNSFEFAKSGAVPGCLEVDLAAALEQFSYTPDKAGTGSGTLEVWLRIAKLDEADTVCSKGDCWGTYKLKSNAEGKLTSIEPKECAGSLMARQLLSGGDFSICLGISAPSAGKITAGSLPVTYCDPVVSCSEPPAVIAGYWSSTYSCTDSCEGDRNNESLSIYLTQDPKDFSKVKYVDTEGGSYSGTLCGKTLTYNGGGSDWIESGTITFDGKGGGVKHSQYSLHKKCCIGRCRDELIRLTEGNPE